LVSVVSRVKLSAESIRVFNFLTNLDNVVKLYPPELRVKVLERPPILKKDSEFKLSFYILGQRLYAKFRIAEYEHGSRIVAEAVESPFRLWRHEHKITKHEGDGTVLEDVLEIKTYLGPFGDYFAGKIMRGIADYRSLVIRRELNGENVIPIFKDPTKLSLALGTVLTLVGTAAGLLITFSFLPSWSVFLTFILGMVSFLLLWYSTHDLAHLIAGALTGVRFSNYYIGLSNLSRILPNKLMTIPITLGIKIDRERTKAGKIGYAAMYLAGPLASMLTPFTAPTWIIIKGQHLPAGYAILLIALFNLVFTAIFSYKVGCIRKAIKAVRG